MDNPVSNTSSNAAVPAITASNTATSGISQAVFATSSGEALHGETNSPIFAAVTGLQLNTSGTGSGVYASCVGKGGAAVWATATQVEAVHGETNSLVNAAITGLQLNPGGTGAGIYAESRGKGPAGFFKGDVQVTGSLTVSGDIILPGADCAEEFDMAGNLPPIPGAVMVIDDQGALALASEPYDSRVAGVISGAGTYRPALTLDRRTDAIHARGAIALIGKAWCQVDASEAPIRVGDLLTTSATPGHAMRADPGLLAPGSILGKALAPLGAGTGLIPMLITLQ